EHLPYKQRVTGSSPVTPIFLCPKTKRSKTREKGATGESYAPTCKRTRGRACNSHLFMSKNKKKQNKGERRNWESHAPTYKRSQEAVEPNNSHFFMSKNEKEKRGRKAQLERACTKVQEDTRQSAVTPIFYAHNRKKLQSENHGLYTQYYEEICTHIFFFCAKMRRRKEKCALDSRENRNPAFVLLFFWKN
ncbi:MAG: hypothetical protein ACLU41_07190, partial [Anaerotignum lactatifermentans]